ncbi:MAG TPA: dienelactone hydrolase family protein [Burkholderiaceae bacterium]|nr:dienelactone hydrolase family protein [Burkholderiaceae bacterium]
MNDHSIGSFCVGIGLALFNTICTAQTVTPMTDFRASPGNGIYSYASTSPVTVMDLLQPNRPRPAATAQGQLVLPANAPTDAKLPAVVLVHGSGGIYPEQISFWAKLLNDQGIAAMVIDVFGPRGVKSTGEDQSQVPFAADTADAYAALGMLSTHPRIDPKRIAVMGFSRGGITVLRSAVTPIAISSGPAGVRFAAHIAVYSGGCAGNLTVSPKPGVFGPAPILFVHGDADDYTYLTDCKIYAQRITAAGTPTEFVTLPGARHKFDVDDSRRINARNNTKTKEGCPLEFDVKELKYRDRRTEEILSQASVATINKDLCADKGASLEGDRKARDTAGKAVIEFLNKTLKS